MVTDFGVILCFFIKHVSPAHFSFQTDDIVGESVCFGNIFYLKRARHRGGFVFFLKNIINIFYFLCPGI